MTDKLVQTNYRYILGNINSFIDSEGYRKERLAKKMGKSTSAFYAYLQGRRPKTTYQFAVELANILGLKEDFFISADFRVPTETMNQYGLNANVFFSGRDFSPKGQEGLKEISKICDLIDIYSFREEMFKCQN